MSSFTVYREDSNIRNPRAHTVKSQAGNFVVHLPVSDHLLQYATFKTGDEFTHCTYTAVTKYRSEDLNEIDTFPRRYQLRVRIFGRQIRLAIVITMYNEDEELFIKTMSAVQQNIAYLCDPRCPFGFGKDGWKNVVCVIVADGRTKANPRTLTAMEVMGIYFDKVARTTIDNVPVEAHIYEFTTQVGLGRKYQLLYSTDGIVPTQTIFILKENNAKKINSHKWFFNAVCETIQPEVTILLDVGTKPTKPSFMHLYNAFKRNPMVGGACGEIKAELGRFGGNLWNPLVAAQNFEYKMSNILDKPMESVFGYISVLPGAFSAYRYEALKGVPLKKYFEGEEPSANITKANLYLAEDRILCFELVTKKNEPWVLKYVKSAQAETDVPDSLDELTSQRRRWLNGSFFAAIHSLIHFGQIYTSPHSFLQKIVFTIQFVYNAIQVWFTWFSIANFYLSFYFLFDIRKGVEKKPESRPGIDPFYPAGDAVFQVLRGLYIYGLAIMCITSLGNRPRGTRWLYKTMSTFFALLMIMMLFMGVWSIRLAIMKFYSSTTIINEKTLWDYLKKTPEFRDMVISVGTTYGLYLLAALFHLDPWHIFTSMVQYLLLQPTYTNIFMVYSFCNLHDVTWGTKGATTIQDTAPASKVINADGTATYEYISTDIDDINQGFQSNTKKMISMKESKENGNKKRDHKTKQEDATKSFRTKVVLFWLFCNAGLVLLFTNDASLTYFFPNMNGSVNPYLTFLFWSFAGLTLFRFLGSCLYMFQWTFEKLSDFGGSPYDEENQ